MVVEEKPETLKAGATPIRTFTINGRRVGAGHPTFVIAELSGNHAQSYEKAVQLVRTAHEAGADAIKLQTYTADTITLKSDRPEFRVGGGTLWDGRTLYDLYQEAYTPWEWQPKLKALANELGMELFSSAFDASAVDFLEGMGVPAHKVASFELVDIPLIRKMASTGKPLILSTGMATEAEIEEAVTAAREAGCQELALLKCTSAYPAPPEEMNLRAIPALAERFGVPVGLSDHTMGIAAPVAAVAVGAALIEKHFTLRRADGGPDSAFSLEPGEFGEMVKSIRVAEKALGSDAARGRHEEEDKSRAYRRSLFVVAEVKKGEVLSEANVRSIRPANGLHPRYLPDVLGKQAARDIARGTPLTWELVAGGAPAATTRQKGLTHA